MGTCCSKDAAETPTSTRSNQKGASNKSGGAADRRAEKLKRYEESSQQRQSTARPEEDDDEQGDRATVPATPPRGVTHTVGVADTHSTVYDVQQIPASPVSRKQDNTPSSPAAATPAAPISAPLALASSVLATTADHVGLSLDTPAVLANTATPADIDAMKPLQNPADAVVPIAAPPTPVVGQTAGSNTAAVPDDATALSSKAPVTAGAVHATEVPEAQSVPPPVVAAAAPSRVSNVLASLLPADDVARDRRAREEIRNAQEINKPKMIEFDVNFDDDDLIAIEDMGDEGELVEDFTVEDESPSRGNQQGDGGVGSGGGVGSSKGTPQKKNTNNNDSGDGVLLFDGINKISGSGGATQPNGADATPTKLDKKWFVDRGVVPPKSIVWKQDKRHVTIRIAPADESSGWELSKDGSILDFTSTAGGRNAKVVLALLHPLQNAHFDLNLMDCVLTFTGEKVPLRQSNDDDDDDDGAADTFPYWTQLIRGSRKDYGALTFISRELEDDDDDAEPQYEYGKDGNAGVAAHDDDAAFSAPEDD